MQRIIATGEFDNSEIVAGINGMIDALKRAEVQQDSITASMGSTQEMIDDSAEGIKKLTAQIAALDKTNKDYAATNQQLTGRLSALQTQYDKYTKTIETQRKQLEASQVTITKMQAAYDATTKSVVALQKETGKPIAPSISDGKLTATLAGVKSKMKQAGTDIATNLTNSTKPAIDKTVDSVASLGEAFGPMGVAAGVALGFIAKKLYELATAETEAEKVQTQLDEAVRSAAQAYGNASVEVGQMTEKVKLAKEGFLDKKQVLDEYNSTIGRTIGFTDDLDVAEQNLIDKGPAYIELMFKKATAAGMYAAAQKEAAKNATNALDTEQNFGVFDFLSSNRKNLSALDKLKQLLNPLDPDVLAKSGVAADKEFNEQVADNKKKIFERYKKLMEGGDAAIEDAAKYAKEHGLAFDPLKPPPDTKKREKEIFNIYEQELQKLKADLAKLAEQGFTDESTITAAIEADFKKRDLAFQKAFKNKQLTAGQLASLQSNLADLQKAVTDDSLKKYGEQRAAYLQKIDDQLTALQNDIDLKRISNLQDSFTRERLTIEAETDKTVAALTARRDKDIAELTKNAGKNGITKTQLQAQVDVVTGTYSDMLDVINAIKNQKLQKLSFDTFEKLSEDAKRILTAGNLGISEASLLRIQETTAQYQKGVLSYQGYQRALTKIARDEANERFKIEKQFLESEISVRQVKLLTDKSLTDDQIKRLQDEITSLEQRLADATKGNITQNTSYNKNVSDQKIQGLLAYANAIKSVTDGVISFWAQTNEAEQKALDRSIALQDRRVEAARNVAAKGNAEYLKMEEERDQQLLIKKENAARRQMAINAALQASQLLVAIIGAIAKIAEPGVGTVDVIASIGVIVGALAGGYALVKSLQQNQPSFFVGTEDTGEGGRADDKGGFHAVLHPHERVMTAEENKKLRGLSNKEVIERVTENYRVKPAPSLNIAAMEMATAQPHRIDAIRMEGIERELKLNNQYQLKTHRLLRSMGVNVNVDRNGLAVSVMEAVNEIEKNKKI